MTRVTAESQPAEPRPRSAASAQPGGSAGCALADHRPIAGRLAQLAALTKQSGPHASAPPPAVEPNRTGLPANLKAGVEALSGQSLDHVRVHRNSAKPAQLNAHAFAQGGDIHLAPGQEKHLPHEAWHVAQQAQGRVKATRQLKAGVPLNDDAGLEREADVMGQRALQRKAAARPHAATRSPSASACVQRLIAGLAAYQKPESIPLAWIDAFKADMQDPTTTISDQDIWDYLSDQVEGWRKYAQVDNPSGNQWLVTLPEHGEEGADVVIKPAADANGGISAIHAVINAKDLSADDDKYEAPSEFIATVRAHFTGTDKSIRIRISNKIKYSTTVAETDFGPRLSALMTTAETEAASSGAESGLTTTTVKSDEAASSLTVREPVANPVVIAVLQTLFADDKPDKLFRKILSEEMKAQGGPDSEGMKLFAGNVASRTDAYLIGWKWNKERQSGSESSGAVRWTYGPPMSPELIRFSEAEPANWFVPEEMQSKIVEAFHRAIWSHVGSHMEDEPGFEPETGFSPSPKYAVGIQSAVFEIGGFMLHFTRRTTESDVKQVCAVVEQLVQTVAHIDPERLAGEIEPNLATDAHNTLETIKSTTGATEPSHPLKEHADAIASATTREHIVTYARAVTARWKQAMNRHIHIVFDRAHLKDAFGASSGVTLTPKSLMKGDPETLRVGQRITINLDAETMSRIYITLAHELAHAIGFNPTDHDPHGHFRNLDLYREAEETYGPRLLFDAYYFEILIQRFMS